ncbi:MAG: nucleotidyltransferase family protein [Vicinamibacterales bacterium]
MIYGIVLAAGASSRMGQAKAALPFGQTGETVLSRIVSTILAGGVTEIAVVAGAHIDAVRHAMPRHERRARVIEHPGWEQGQLSSLLAGLDAIDGPLLEAVMVTPVDVPLVTPFTVAAVISAWRRTHAPIVRPADPSTSLRASEQRHGHPVIFDRAIFADLRAADPNIGAKAVFAIHRDRIVNVEVKDAGAFEDIDTPEDYQRLLRS